MIYLSLDGNKRTAAAAALAFLRVNGKSTKYDVDEFLEFVVPVVEGQADLNAINLSFGFFCPVRLRQSLTGQKNQNSG